LGLSYVVCPGRDLWKSLVGVVEVETCRVAAPIGVLYSGRMSGGVR
jgi:hypothetical protein